MNRQMYVLKTKLNIHNETYSFVKTEDGKYVGVPVEVNENNEIVRYIDEEHFFTEGYIKGMRQLFAGGLYFEDDKPRMKIGIGLNSKTCFKYVETN